MKQKETTMKKTKQFILNFLACIIFFTQVIFSQAPCSSPCIVTPYFSARSQGVNAARHASGMLNQFHLYEVETLYGTLSITPEYTRTFHTQDIAHCLFSDALINNVITISGSRVANRGPRDWLADYFYLPTDFKSTLHFNPLIDNFLVDFNFYIGLDDWYQGLYFYVYAPLVHTRWNLRMRECIINSGVNAYPAGYFTPAILPRGQLNNSFTEFANGRVINPVDQTITLPLDAGSITENFSTVLQPLQHAKISTKRLVRSRLADMRMFFGIDWLRDYQYHFGCGVQIAAPTGNRPEAEFLFEPIVGTGHHWEMGGMLNSHYTWWLNESETASISLLTDLNLTHLFKAEQKRTFDLKNSAVSRYMLAVRLGNSSTGTPITNNLMGGGQTPSAQFQNEFAPMANLTTFCVNTRSAVQVDMVVMMNLFYKGFSWDLGYNFWARTCEKLSRCGAIPTAFDNNTTWALKGDSQVIGFTATAEAGADANRLPANFPVNLSVTQDSATLYSGSNFPLTGASDLAVFNAGRTNPNIDNPRLATAGPTVATGSQVNLTINPDSGASARINTSINPIFIDILDVNFCPAQSKGISSKIFTHFNYTWQHCCRRWIPYIGLGGEAEFAHNTKHCVRNGCPSCALSQWGIWIKGGISFE